MKKFMKHFELCFKLYLKLEKPKRERLMKSKPHLFRWPVKKETDVRLKGALKLENRLERTELERKASQILSRVPEGHVLRESDFFQAMQKTSAHPCPTSSEFWKNTSPSKHLPLWRIVTDNGDLISYYPGGEDSQSKRLIREGHTVCLEGYHLQASIPDFHTCLIRLQELFA
jgi:alkylated DNA nucleotide flippase Atl1